MDFKQYVEGDTLLFSSNAINISDLVSFLERNQSITRLILRFSKIGDEGAKVLASGNLPNLTSLELSGNNISGEGAKELAKLSNLTSLDLELNKIGDEGAKELAKLSNLTSLDLWNNSIGDKSAEALANGKLSNLTSLNLGCNNIGNKGTEALANGKLSNLTSLNLWNNSIGDKGAEALANGKLSNLTSLNLRYNDIGDKGAEVLANGNLSNLTSLNLRSNNIGDKGAEALANVNLTKFTTFDLSYNNIDFEHIEVLARSQCSGIKLNNRDQEVFYDFLLKKCSNNQVVDEESIKKMIFNVARSNYSGDLVRYILTQPDKYPFLINSKDEQWHTLSHFYSHSPEMQEFLFKHGLVPEKDSTLRNITNDKQSVHAGLAVKKTKFITKNLVESIKASEGQLEQAVNSYVKSIPKLLKEYQNDQAKIGLLSLTESEKRNVMETTLHNGDTIPSNKEFIKTVIDKAKQVLEEKCLRKDLDGEYYQGYFTTKLQYDYTEGSEKFITIPESIGYIKLLIDRFSIPLRERKELLVTLANQNQELVRSKLSEIRLELGNNNVSREQITNKTEFYKLLSNVDPSKISEKVNKLFKEISGLNIEETWKEQKEFVLLKQIYLAATTYGENRNACTQGTWSQIINSVSEIDSELMKQYYQHLEEEKKKENQKEIITEENITAFVENLAGKLIQYVKDNPELKEALVDFALAMVDIESPEKIPLEQQKILAKINQEFTASIEEFLPNYGRSIPKESEYKSIINKLPEVKVMQDFAQEESNQQDLQPEILPAVSSGNSKQPSYPVIAVSTLTIAGVVLGVTIAVYLEMLAVGIAVGACCLVAAAIIYYCNRPSNSLERSSAETVGVQGKGHNPICSS